MEIDKLNFKNIELKEYVKLLLNNGFRVFVYDSKENEKISYIIIEKNNKIGYIQLNDFGGFQFSTKHKPNKTTGTGYALNYNESLNPTIENAEKTFINYPDWAKKKDISSIEKYKSIDEYLNSEMVLKYIEVKL